MLYFPISRRDVFVLDNQIFVAMSVCKKLAIISCT